MLSIDKAFIECFQIQADWITLISAPKALCGDYPCASMAVPSAAAVFVFMASHSEPSIVDVSAAVSSVICVLGRAKLS